MTTEPTPLDLDELERLLAAAMPGPWVLAAEVDGWRAGRLTVVKAAGKRVVTVDQTRPHHEPAEPNIALIVAMRNALPALVERARAADTAEQTLVRVRSALSGFGHEDWCQERGHGDCCNSMCDCVTADLRTALAGPTDREVQS